jgi:hypothetical protein
MLPTELLYKIGIVYLAFHFRINFCGRSSLMIIPLILSYCITLSCTNLSYCITVWGSASDTKLRQLTKQQNIMIRSIGHNRNQLGLHTCQLYKILRIMNIRDLYKYHMCILLYKIVNNQCPSSLRKRVINNQINTNRYLRTSHSHLRKPQFTLVKSTNSFNWKGVDLWNSLPANLRSIRNINIFKIKLRNHITK